MPSPGLLESKKDYAKRVIDEVLPDYKKSKIEALQALHTEKEVKALRQIAEKAEVYLKALDDVPELHVDLFNNKIKETASLIKNKHENDIQKEVEKYNNKIELINTHKNNFECFYDYCNSELKAKIDNEKLLKKEYEKTENWLKKNNLTEKEFNKGWKDDGSKIYIDKPDFYMSEYQYNQSNMQYAYEYKKNIHDKSKELEIDETVSILKQNPENQIGKRFQNKLDDYYENFEPVINDVERNLERLKELETAKQTNDAARSAQQAVNEQIAKDALEVYMQQKKAENELYRASRSDVNKDQDNSLDIDNTFRPFD